MALDSKNPVASIYENNTKDDEEGLNILDKLSNNVDEESLITDRITVIKLVEDLKDKEKQVIMLRYFKNKTQMQVAKILGITQVQVSRIEKKILSSMKRKL